MLCAPRCGPIHDQPPARRRAPAERFLRESLSPRIAPVSRELIMSFIAEKVLGLPRSY
jgi:acyl-CoA dehydrogenase